MLRNRQWEMAAAMPVATLAMLTVPDTEAGLGPAPSKMLELVGPKPIPSAPSTSEAQNPARATSKSSSIDNCSHRLHRKYCRLQETTGCRVSGAATTSTAVGTGRVCPGFDPSLA